MFNKQLTARFTELRTPFYYYDTDCLESNLDTINKESGKYGFRVHYALKANANESLLRIIASKRFGADCVSGNEIRRARECGFNSAGIVYAGVGKSDREIETAIDADILCFNCESLAEIKVINSIAAGKDKIVPIALRINPDVEAYTHKYITTGIEENKFGINIWEIEKITNLLPELTNVNLIGIHFHIGSQIIRMSAFRSLCSRVNEIQSWFSTRGIPLSLINVGGGLGVDYSNPGIWPDFREYFSIFAEHLELKAGQTLHFELGRSVVAQCGSLISKVLYVKNGGRKKFVILDAGMTDLIRPALYQSYHKIENLSSETGEFKYDVVGPICETTDSFASEVALPETKRGDIIAIRTAGAYGEAMASRYNLRDLPGSVLSSEL